MTVLAHGGPGGLLLESLVVLLPVGLLVAFARWNRRQQQAEASAPPPAEELPPPDRG